ncbi:hypothetical protein M408DRAFT_313176 [Serendipita vermifera MAFF 305830]|uniref:Uncharacterized protein n=1 Tax=Serendipita vermifera MAFF 305830 TaxID=933852 RepID=A0A0C2X403_SERVB|nr:hypothetical protein M408DRAFT_313176 [Serendipita vermifera MAFF 305830]
MEEDSIYTIVCVIHSRGAPFSVEIARDRSVGHLKNLIKAKVSPMFDQIPAHYLDLYRVDATGSTEKERREAVARADLTDKLRVTRMWYKVYPSIPPKETIHIVAKPPRPPKRKRDDSESDLINEPGAKRGVHTLAEIDGSTAQRNLTVDALYERLNEYHFVLVRGPPGSGKSTLAQLLANHIRIKEPTVDPILINAWPGEDYRWSSRLTEKYDPRRSNTIIVDDSQLSYWDAPFYNGLLKNIGGRDPNRVILFASYGKPNTRVSVKGTNMIVPLRQNVSLRPIDHEDEIVPAGLFLTSNEFTDMVQKKFPAGHFAGEFLDGALHFTAGHAGAVCRLLQAVLAHNSYREVEANNGEYSLEIFHSQFPISELWLDLDKSSRFRRGLPSLNELQSPKIARVLRAVLSNNHVTKEMMESPDDKQALRQCFEMGWLHATVYQWDTMYIFTTSLHQWFVEYYLGNRVLDPNPINDQPLSEFAINVIRLFSHLRLSSPRKVGASDTHRPPATRFQDEFYRCCLKYSNGSLISFPHLENARGRIDYYIPQKKWGIELLGDGDRLETHSSRFTGSGAYAEMDFTDCITLDFQNKPQKTHLG